MIKTFGLLIILFTSSLAGFIYGESFKKRCIQLKEMERCLVQLQNEILYTFTPLPEALYKVAIRSKEPLKSIFMNISELLSSNEVNSVFEAFIQVFEKNEGKLNMTDEDKGIIFDLAKSLGESDIEAHKKIFSLSIDSIKTNIKDAEEKTAKNTKMYRYLGVCIGGIIVILLI